MREIKFRVWDKEEKRMINSDEPIWKDDWEGNTYLKLSMNGLLCTAYWNKQKYDYYKEKFELMQYTGLKDKNGKEIYESDLVKRESEIGEIRWDGLTARFRVYMDNKKPIPRNYPLWTELLEVIGNIYEIPELLNPTNKE